MDLGRTVGAFAFVLLAGSTAHAETGIPCRYYGMNPGAPVWGGSILLDQPYAQQIAAAGAHAVRVDFRLDTHASWTPEALATYDVIVDAVIAAGLEPMGLMAYEAVTGGQIAWNDDPDGDGDNAYVQAFSAQSSVLFTHFASRIKRWEVWNEPSCWSDSSYASDPQHAGCSYILPRVFAKLLAEVFVNNEALLQNESIELVMGALFAHDIGGSFTTAEDYMTQMYAQSVWDWLEANKGRRYPWDLLGYHPYVRQGEAIDGTKITAYLDAMRTLALQNDDSARFTITEFGWTTASVSQQVQAGNLTIAFSTMAHRSDVDQAFWFSFRDAPAANLYFGLTEGNGTAKESFAAMLAAAASCVMPSVDAGPDGMVDADIDASDAAGDAVSEGKSDDDAMDGSSPDAATEDGGTGGQGYKSTSNAPDSCACGTPGRSRRTPGGQYGWVILLLFAWRRRAEGGKPSAWPWA